MWLNTEFPWDLHAAQGQTLIVDLPVLFSSPGKLKAAKAASTVLSNMFQYKKLHKDYKQVSDQNATVWRRDAAILLHRITVKVLLSL